MKIGIPASAAEGLRCRFTVAAAAAVMLPFAVAQQGGSQYPALAFDSGRAATSLAIEQAIREGDPWEQLSWTFTLRPSVLYRQYLDERGGELLNPRLSATLQLRFGEKPVDSVRRALKLERALRAHARAGRLEVRDALLSHAELLLAQDAERLAAEALAGLSADATALENQAAQLALRTEQVDLATARTAAASFGFHGTASYEHLRFAVPAAPRVGDLSLFRLQELALAEAEARYVTAGAASVLRDFRLGAGIRGEGVDFDIEAGLLAGRPGVRIATIHPGGRARMEIRVSAEFAVGDSLSDLPYLADEVERARDELELLATQLQAQWLVALEAASLAEAELDLAEAELQEATATRADREVQRLQTRVYRAWITYVRRQHELLEAGEGEWGWRP